MPITLSKIRGMFLGIAIGDALGFPVENFSPEKIKEKYPKTKGHIKKYIKSDGHKRYSGEPIGITTDDTQLTLATARSIIDAKQLCMYSQAYYYIKSGREEGTKFWGRSSREAFKVLDKGVHWSQSGIMSGESGMGNGVIMKMAPIAAYAAMRNCLKSYSFLMPYTLMTHYSQLALSASIVHMNALIYCLYSKPGNFKGLIFGDEIRKGSNLWRTAMLADDSEDCMPTALATIDYLGSASIDNIVKLHKGGYCYVYHSLPFAYSFFLRHPKSIKSLYECVSAGGDADSNGAIVGALLGALNGTRIFPNHLVKGLIDREKVLNVADKFYKTISRIPIS